jgi:uncharacterized membrane protein
VGKLGVLYIGEPFVFAIPAHYMVAEPLIDLSKVEASLWIGNINDVRRSMRIYMPRSYEDLVEKFDVVVISDANMHTFRQDHIQWIGDSVEDNGMGLFMPGGYESLGGFRDNPSWGPTRVGEVLPTDVFEQGFYLEQPSAVAIDSLDMGDPFIKSLPWDTLVEPYNIFGQGGGMNKVLPREGSRTIAQLRRLRDGFMMPLLVLWDIGTGRSMIMSPDWTPAAAGLFIEWDYYGDFVVGLMLHSGQRGIPQDYELLHRIRSRFYEYGERKNLVISMIDFIDKFGANSRPVGVIIARADELRKLSGQDYILYEFEASQVGIEDALARLEEARALAFRLKDSALFWVYLTEWSAISGTSILCGSVLYALMVRRRIYREVGTTRSNRSQGG